MRSPCNFLLLKTLKNLASKTIETLTTQKAKLEIQQLEKDRDLPPVEDSKSLASKIIETLTTQKAKLEIYYSKSKIRNTTTCK